MNQTSALLLGQFFSLQPKCRMRDMLSLLRMRQQQTLCCGFDYKQTQNIKSVCQQPQCNIYGSIKVTLGSFARFEKTARWKRLIFNTQKSCDVSKGHSDNYQPGWFKPKNSKKMFASFGQTFYLGLTFLYCRSILPQAHLKGLTSFTHLPLMASNMQIFFVYEISAATQYNRGEWNFVSGVFMI